MQRNYFPGPGSLSPRLSTLLATLAPSQLFSPVVARRRTPQQCKIPNPSVPIPKQVWRLALISLDWVTWPPLNLLPLPGGYCSPIGQAWASCYSFLGVESAPSGPRGQEGKWAMKLEVARGQQLPTALVGKNSTCLQRLTSWALEALHLQYF